VAAFWQLVMLVCPMADYPGQFILSAGTCRLLGIWPGTAEVGKLQTNNTV